MTSPVDRRRRKLLMILVVACHLYPFPYYEDLNNPNEHVRLYMTMAMVEGGTFAIDEPTRRYGWVNDRAEHGGHLYAGKAPGASFLGVPVYAAASWIADLLGHPLDRRAAVRLLRLFAVTLPGLVFLVFFRRFLDELDGPPWLRDALFLAYALGSMAYAYNLMFAGHQLAAAALTGALIAYYRAGKRLEEGEEPPTLTCALGGLLLGAAPAMEYPAAIGAAIVALYAVVLLRRRPWLLAAALAPALLPAALVAAFHTAAFGSPLAFPYDSIENPAFQRLLAEGWQGATYPHLDRLATMLLAPSFGLLFFTPPLVLAPLGWVVQARRWRELPPSRRHLIWVLPAVALALILYLASSALWRAGWAVGPRYIASVVPFLVLAAQVGGAALVRRYGPKASAPLATAVLLALLHGGTSGALYPHQPEPFDNPVYDLNLRLIELGFAPHHALEWLGLRGYMALLPLGLAAFVAALALSFGPRRARSGSMIGHALGAWLLAAVCALVLSTYGETSRAEERMWSLVVRTWEPRGWSAPERRLAELEAIEDPTPDQLRAMADAHQLLGRARAAARLRREARQLQRRRERRAIDEKTLLPSLELNPTWGAGEP